MTLRLGLCLPLRPSLHEPGSETPALWGCLGEAIHAPLMQRLRADERWRCVEHLDVRQAMILGGEVEVGGARVADQVDAYFWYAEIDRTPGSFHLEALKTLALSIPVFPDPWKWEVAVDKYRAHLALRRAGVAVPDFMLCDAGTLPLPKLHAQLEEVLSDWGAAVLKPRRGAWGKGVMLVDDSASLRDLIGYVRATTQRSPDGGYFLERYLDNDLDEWVSATMIGGEIMYGYKKRASKHAAMRQGRYKIFDADERGGEVDEHALSAAHVEQAARASQALGCPIIGFDMIFTAQGPVIVDENTSPGNYPELYAQVGREPAAAFVEMIAGCVLE